MDRHVGGRKEHFPWFLARYIKFEYPVVRLPVANMNITSTLISHWFVVIFIFVLNGLCEYFGFGFSTLS